MNEQDNVQSSTKQRRSRKTSTANQQHGKPNPAVQQPANDDREAWKAYWQEQVQFWRTEPEINNERQEYLTERRSITPDIEKGIYPFKDIKLSRADVEWLLATHENGRGPIDWNDEKQRKRKGLDLRGTDLSKENLSGLPLARLNSGLIGSERFVTEEQSKMASVRMEEVNLKGAQLQNAYLREAGLQQANLFDAQLLGAYLYRAQLQKANLSWALLQQTNLRDAQLQGAIFFESQLLKTYLKGAQLQASQLSRAKMDDAVLDGAILSDEKYGSAFLADVGWGEVNLAVVDWGSVKKLGDEQLAHQTEAIDDYRAAVRANRQLSVVLQHQGLNEEADHFAYRAQLLQRVVWRRQRRILKYIFSWFLYLIAGYGYRPLRSIIWYIAIICGFAMAYHFLGQLSLFPPDAFVFSIMSFHGRGFFPSLSSETNLHNPLVMLAALEAIVGLLIEISFIATFTQRFFGK